MAHLHKRENSGNCTVNLGNTKGGHYGDNDQHLRHSSQGMGSMTTPHVGHVGYDASPGLMHHHGEKGWSGMAMYGCFLAIIVLFILLFYLLVDHLRLLETRLVLW